MPICIAAILSVPNGNDPRKLIIKPQKKIFTNLNRKNLEKLQSYRIQMSYRVNSKSNIDCEKNNLMFKVPWYDLSLSFH